MKSVANKKYMIIAVSALIAKFTARNNGGAARPESNPQLHIFPNASKKHDVKLYAITAKLMS